jgi:RNA polymerase sigma-B factor
VTDPDGSSVDDRLALERYAATRDPDTREWLVERFRGLALYHARRFTNKGIEREDLEQVAMVGLLNAIERFDPGRGFDLSTFASRTIEGEIKRHFRDRGWAVRVPRRVRDLSVGVRRTIGELENELARAPRPSEIAERLGVDVDDVIDALDARSACRTSALDIGSSPEDDRSHPQLGQTDRGFEHSIDRIVLDELLESLPDREATIVRLRFYDQLTQSEIAARVGISQMHVSRLLTRILEFLRKGMDNGDTNY